MKERRNKAAKRPAHLEKNGRKRPGHAELSTRKPREAAPKPKVERGPVSDDLLRALRAWGSARQGGEQSQGALQRTLRAR